MRQNVFLGVRHGIAGFVLVGLLVWVGVCVADPPFPDCDGTMVDPAPSGLCGTATPCPSIDNQATCATDPVTYCVARFPNFPGCVTGGTKSQKCVPKYDKCTQTFICTWMRTQDGVWYCNCGSTPYLNGGNPVFSLQGVGFFVDCIDKG